MNRITAISMIFVLVLSTLTSPFPVTSVHADSYNVTEEIPENSLRIHYDYGDLELGDLALWLWGDVLEPSDNWPNGEPFLDSQTTDFGSYLDIPMQDGATNIGLLVIDSNETKHLDDTEIELISPDVNEIWLTHEGEVYYYEPIEFDEPTIRIHYQTESDQYEPWGVWYWGDVVQESGDNGEWPVGATPFLNNQIGPYGAYVDILVNDSMANFGFLLVERIEDGDQTDDMSFTDFEQHQQIFIKEGTEEVFTNPYYITTDIVEEDPDEYEGEADIEVHAEVNQSFHYDQHALLDVEITNESDLEIRSIEADVRALGGSDALSISPELNRVTLSVRSDIEPGEKKYSGKSC